MRALIMKSKRLELRRTQDEDLSIVIAMEQDPDNSPYIEAWPFEQHRQTLDNEDYLHLVMESRNKGVIGFVIACGLADPSKNIELKRIVVAEKGKGYGKEALKSMMAFVFQELKGNRLWLDVYEHNERARSLYDSLGFQAQPGRLRATDIQQPSDATRTLMAILDNEYFAHRQARGNINRM
ncbi:RimJ/RimL family protein N-acetyltransferase [Paenibacillus phyllosphaerae]|uniref:RimJ/RimL family protein N-acetyltransferase n=1 Tax=Paenibacillus phyllosphaerae TaxID=274593 RepID=A0A7W5B4R7_9BACL|nr:GNAT family N-acetyltransferase [Paenibacillus phyllosphaerae]MBB3114395.1 RimJ/RimL family protein N-acetyltransferase [Paenibacillus phyllosphaerae]